jgi:hypothetical protein
MFSFRGRILLLRPKEEEASYDIIMENGNDVVNIIVEKKRKKEKNMKEMEKILELTGSNELREQE